MGLVHGHAGEKKAEVVDNKKRVVDRFTRRLDDKSIGDI